jgi:hypothetical protein
MQGYGEKLEKKDRKQKEIQQKCLNRAIKSDI